MNTLITSTTCKICERIPERPDIDRLDADSPAGMAELAMLNLQRPPMLPVLILDDEVLMGEDAALWFNNKEEQR